MKLIKCHIENFGKLSDFTYCFGDGLNVFCEENGWGKSTLAAFLKAMLYGFENEGKRDGLENERKRYRPWQGGVYGGSLSFEVQEKRYLSERSFGTKPSEDVFVLRDLDTNMECGDFSAALGEDIFQIDAKSFGRTIYISQNDCEAVVTDAVHAKMGNLVDATDDINNYDTAISGFKKTLNEMTPHRKTGSIYKLGEQIAKKSNELRLRPELESSAARISDYRDGQRKKYDRLSQELDSISDRQQALGSYMEHAAKREEYERMKSRCEERRAVFLAESEYFKGGIPKEQELDLAAETNISLAAERISAEKYTLSEAERELISAGKRRFSKGVPDHSEIEAAYQFAEKLKELETARQRNELSVQEREEYESGMAFFRNRIPQESEIEEYIREWNEYRERKSAVESKRSAFYALQQMNRQNRDRKRKNARKAVVFLLICGIVLLLIYGAMLFLGRSAGAAAAVLGGAVILAALIILIVQSVQSGRNIGGSKSGDFPEDADRMPIEKEIEQDQRYMDEIQARILAFFGEFGLGYSETTALETLYNLKNRADGLRKLADKAEDPERPDRNRRIEETASRLQEFLGRYEDGDMAFTDSYEARIRRLSESANEYERIGEKERSFESACGRTERLTDELNAFLEKYGFGDKFGENYVSGGNDRTELLSDIRSHFRSYIPAKAEYDRSVREKSEFEKENDIEGLMGLQKPEGEESLEELNARAFGIRGELEQINKNILDYDRQLDALQERMEELDGLVSELEAEKEQYEAKKREYDLISRTKTYMEKAKLSFTAKYAAPVKNGFDKYYSMINGKLPEEYYIDADNNVTVYEAGMQRESRFLSRGLQDMTGICMRMALIEAMYRDEKPFVIFDDPFVNLDAPRVDGGLRFLGRIAAEYQVVYFTCHPGRAGNEKENEFGEDI